MKKKELDMLGVVAKPGSKSTLSYLEGCEFDVSHSFRREEGTESEQPAPKWTAKVTSSLDPLANILFSLRDNIIGNLRKKRNQKLARGRLVKHKIRRATTASNNYLVEREDILIPREFDTEDSRMASIQKHEEMTSADLFSLAWAMVGWGAQTLDYEITYNHSDSNSTLSTLLRCLTSVTTILLLLGIHNHYRIKLEMDMIRNYYVENTSLFDTNLKWKYLLEMVIYSIHCPPGANFNITIVQTGISVSYSFLAMTLIIMSLRWFLILRMTGHFTRYTGAEAHRVCQRHGVNADYTFAMKAIFKVRALILLLILLVFFVFWLGVILRIAERPSQAAFEYIWNGAWVAVLTMTTIGYGEIYPITHVGRFIDLIAALLGSFVLSLFLVSVTNLLQHSYNENMAYEEMIEAYKIKRALHRLSVRFIEAVYKLYKLRANSATPARRRDALLYVEKVKRQFAERRKTVFGDLTNRNEVVYRMNKFLLTDCEAMKSSFVKIMDLNDIYEDYVRPLDSEMLHTVFTTRLVASKMEVLGRLISEENYKDHFDSLMDVPVKFDEETFLPRGSTLSQNLLFDVPGSVTDKSEITLSEDYGVYTVDDLTSNGSRSERHTEHDEHDQKRKKATQLNHLDKNIMRAKGSDTSKTATRRNSRNSGGSYDVWSEEIKTLPSSDIIDEKEHEAETSQSSMKINQTQQQLQSQQHLRERNSIILKEERDRKLRTNSMINGYSQHRVHARTERDRSNTSATYQNSYARVGTDSGLLGSPPQRYRFQTLDEWRGSSKTSRHGDNHTVGGSPDRHKLLSQVANSSRSPGSNQRRTSQGGDSPISSRRASAKGVFMFNGGSVIKPM